MHDLKRPHSWSGLLAAWLGLLVAACAAPAAGPAAPSGSPAAATSPALSPAPAAASPSLSPAPAAPSPVAASQAASPVVLPPAASSPSPAVAQASPGPVAIERYRALLDANTAYAQGDLSTALRLYRSAAEDTSPLATPAPDRSTAEQQLRALARFRYLVASVAAGQEDEARAALEKARLEDGATPFLGLGLTFWDAYGMTADPAVACRRVNDLVAEEPAAVLRSLSSFEQTGPPLKLGQVCQLPGS